MAGLGTCISSRSTISVIRVSVGSSPGPAGGCTPTSPLLGYSPSELPPDAATGYAPCSFSWASTYVELLDKTAYLNHYYWAVLVSLLMVFLPLHRSLSADAWVESRTAPGQRPAAALWLLRGQLAAVYVFAGIAKLNGDWLLESQPLHIWLQDHTGLPLAGPFLARHGRPMPSVGGGALFDLTIVDWLLWRRTRPFAYAALGLFHLTTYMLFPQIGVFPGL